MSLNRDRSVAAAEAEADILLVVQSDADEKKLTEALSRLCAFSGRKSGRDMLRQRFEGTAVLHALLKHSSPKVRKNSARLIGRIGSEKDIEVLASSLSKEVQRYVVPSLILSIGKIGGENAEQILRSYRTPESWQSEPDKNLEEIRLSLRKALDSVGQFEKGRICVLPQRMRVLLIPPYGFSNTLSNELAERGFSAESAKNGCIVLTDQIAELYKIRCAREILIPLGKAGTVEKIGSLFKPYAEDRYRIELRNYKGNRKNLIRKLAGIIGGEDSPSAYTSEFRVVFGSNGETAACYWKPCNVPDERYAYRVKTIPASMHPATAACIVRYALDLMGRREDADVLDPCCGSGTLLFEREIFGTQGTLLGYDISGEAVEAAQTNAAEAGSRAIISRLDSRGLSFDGTIHEVYANLPFGNRVGTHIQNMDLYHQLINKIPAWLDAGGFCALYTMESELIKKLLVHNTELRIRGHIRTEAGGLFPHLYVLVKKGKV